MKTDLIEVYHKTISKVHCDQIIRYFEKDERIGQGLTGAGYTPNSKISTDLGCNFNDDFNFGLYNQLLVRPLIAKKDEYIKKHPVMNDAPVFVLDERYNIQRYKEGEGFFQVHCEQCGEFPLRCLAWSLFLNDAECGTYFTHYDRTVQPKAGSLIIFPAFWTHMHRGVVPNKGLKYIATGWWEYVPCKPVRPKGG